MTAAERNAVREQCAVIAEREMDGEHAGNERAQQIADLIRLSMDQPTIDPTSRGDLVAEKVRRWYEVNRESWWARHHPNADRKYRHADEFMLRLVAAVLEAEGAVKW